MIVLSFLSGERRLFLFGKMMEANVTFWRILEGIRLGNVEYLNCYKIFIFTLCLYWTNQEDLDIELTNSNNGKLNFYRNIFTNSHLFLTKECSYFVKKLVFKRIESGRILWQKAINL